MNLQQTKPIDTSDLIESSKKISALQKILSYFLATRPKTLMVSLSVWLTGTGLSITYHPHSSFIIHGMVLFCMMCLQMAVNYLNDALDTKRGKDTHQRLGPQRMSQSGRLSFSELLDGASVLLSLAIVSGLYLVAKGGWPILAIGTIGLLATYFYSAPPISLADRGLSELFVFLFFGVLAVCGIFYLNTGHWSLDSLMAGSQMGCLSIGLLLVNHLRDHKEDLQTGKRTWVVRKGRNFGFIQLALSILLPYILGYYWLVAKNNWEASIFPFCVLPIYMFIFYRITKENPSSKYNFYLALISFSQLLFATTLVMGWMGFSFFAR